MLFLLTRFFWKGDLDSYLIEITAEILRKREENGQGHVIDKILDAAGQKGTGKWTAKVELFLVSFVFKSFFS